MEKKIPNLEKTSFSCFINFEVSDDLKDILIEKGYKIKESDNPFDDMKVYHVSWL